MSSARSATRWSFAVLVAFGLFVSAAPAAGGAPAQENTTLRLGYFPNVTHASAIVGVEGGSSRGSAATT